MPEVVLDTDDLLRRVIYTNPHHVRPDLTATSFAFTPRKLNGVQEGLSVDISRLTTYETSIRDRFNYRLYSIKANYVRGLGLECIHDPLEDNPAHAQITGNITSSISKKLSIQATRVPFPD